MNILHTITAFIIALLTAILPVNSPSLQQSTLHLISPIPTPKPIIPHDLLVDFNEYRLNHNLQPVVENKELCKLAEIRAKQIPTDWSHKGFDPLADQFLLNHRQYYKIGENLARFYATPQAVMIAWDKSPKHKANLVEPNYSQVCFRVNGNYIVQILGELIPKGIQVLGPAY